MVNVNAKKRVIKPGMLRELAKDVLDHLSKIDDPVEREEHMVAHFAGAIDAHCVLLQRALCVHCGNGVPLLYVKQWNDWLHNGELTCIAGRAREIMGIEPQEQHILQDGKKNDDRRTLL
jgi:hypothetical protein